MTFQLPQRTVRQAGVPHLSDEEFGACYPATAMLLGASVDASGAPRRGCTLTIFAEDGVLKGVLREREQMMALFLTLDPAKDIWGQIEAYVVNHPDRWRQDKPPDRGVSNGRR